MYVFMFVSLYVCMYVCVYVCMCHVLIWADGVEKTLPYQQFQRHLTLYKRAFVQQYAVCSPESETLGAAVEKYYCYGVCWVLSTALNHAGVSFCFYCLCHLVLDAPLFRPLDRRCIPIDRAHYLTVEAPLLALLQLLRVPLSATLRSEKDKDIIELVLTILRNIIAAPDPGVIHV